MNLPAVNPPDINIDSIILVIYNSPTLQTVILGVFIFFMVVLFAMSRRYLIHSSLKGLHAGIIIGVIILAGLEGGGVYAMKEFTKGDKGNVIPPNIRTLLSSGQQQAVQVLGAETERKIPTAQSVVSDYEDLSKLDAKLVKDSICKPSSSPVTGTID